jgi:hypothetical protein
VEINSNSRSQFSHFACAPLAPDGRDPRVAAGLPLKFSDKTSNSAIAKTSMKMGLFSVYLKNHVAFLHLEEQRGLAVNGHTSAPF